MELATGIYEGERLLNFDIEFDPALMDRVVGAVFMPTSPEQQQVANKILVQFKAHPRAWEKADSIMELCKNPQAKFFALSILEETIKANWKMLPADQRESIKAYTVNLVIEKSTDSATLVSDRPYLHKINVILVQILKQEWPHNWPSFIPDIVSVSKTNETMCENNMVILKFMSEEVFDFSGGQLTQRKARYLKDTMCNQFGEVFELCIFVINNASSPPLLLATLETLLKFLTWIPVGYMFETNLVDLLIKKFLVVTQYRNLTLRCLHELCQTELKDNRTYDSQLIKLYHSVLVQIRVIIPPSSDIAIGYETGNSVDQDFVQSLSMFLSGFLRKHGTLLENDIESRDDLWDGLHYLLAISNVNEMEIFKICLEYWHGLTGDLYGRESLTPTASTFGQSIHTPRRDLYAPILSKVRRLMISHMVKPEEVLVVENENGEIVREFMPQHTDTLTQYKVMRETLVYLTHLDGPDTSQIMTQLLKQQTDENYWSWKGLNTLCWAIGSISGSMTEEKEKSFLVTVIKHLLSLCEMKRGKDNKAVVASNIMYIVGQYPRFLRAHWKFLKTVVQKLFEFMHELHEGVQDMACDTFIKIAKKCGHLFVMMHPGEICPFVDEVLDQMNSIICDLHLQQVDTFYEAMGHAIAAETNPNRRDELITRLMAIPNQAWDSLIQDTAVSLPALVQDSIKVKQLTHFLKTNTAACSTIGQPFILQLGRIYADLLVLYKGISAMITHEVAANGPSVTKTHQVKQVRGIKKETLRLLETWIKTSTENQFLAETFVPPLFDCLLVDYKQSLPHVREAEVLSLCTSLITKLQGLIGDMIPAILGSVFEVTLEMINKDFSEFPEHRTNFFNMIEAIVCGECFQALFLISEATFKLIIDALFWALRHTMRNVSDTGLTILSSIFTNIRPCEVATTFYQTYYLQALQNLLAILSDSAYQAGFKRQSTVLSQLLWMVQTGVISAPLFDPAVHPADMNNILCVQQFLSNLLLENFPNLQPGKLKRILEELFAKNSDLEEFRNTLQDFLIEIK
eukprot:Ihof_evm3s296 gene=Ihof_evmTU3s296